jgi:hypothetical protein
MRWPVGTRVVEHPAQTEDPRGAEDDLTLVHASKRGHASAFEKLVRKYDRKLLRIAQSVTHNREDAEDAVQDAIFCRTGDLRIALAVNRPVSKRFGPTLRLLGR